jgi:hypothetical protein
MKPGDSCEPAVAPAAELAQEAEQTPVAVATIEAWRASGAHLRDPVRFRLIDALCRRAQAHRGATRRVLDERLTQLIAAHEARLALPAPVHDHVVASRPSSPCPTATHRAVPAVRAAAARPVHRSALRSLLDELAHPAPAAALPGAARPQTLEPPTPAPAELKAVRYFKRTWTRLSAEQRLTQALSKVPENPGPLNSNHLVHRALLLMREGSPEYLHRFMSYVDTLLWLDDLQAAAFNAKPSVREAGERKPSRQRGA